MDGDKHTRSRSQKPWKHWSSSFARPVADDTEEADTEATVDGGDVLAFRLISKAFRPEFEARAASERAPDRDSAVPGGPQTA
jgi:hypothetical protein